eukprot:317004-Chlamydomonas_euryale.AAC.2
MPVAPAPPPAASARSTASSAPCCRRSQSDAGHTPAAASATHNLVCMTASYTANFDAAVSASSRKVEERLCAERGVECGVWRAVGCMG